MEDTCIYEGDKVGCSCGNQIGTDMGKWIKMKQNSFYYSGTKNQEKCLNIFLQNPRKDNIIPCRCKYLYEDKLLKKERICNNGKIS